MRELCARWCEQLAWLDEQIAQTSRRLQRCAQDSPMCRHLMRRQGIGVINAVALSTQIDPAHFRNGRHLSAFVWITQLIQRRGRHKAIVATANKLARYVWVDMMQARQAGIA